MSGEWIVGTVLSTQSLTADARSIRISVPGWAGSVPGQHADVRLTAEDGYTAVRSYSLASSGSADTVELAVDRLPDGEVSPYLVDEVREGDQLELRGPLGTWFVWHADDPFPVQLIGGGSGIVPLMAMVRAHRDAHSSADFRLLYSVRSPDDAFYADELAEADTAPDAHLAIDRVWTRRAPSAADGSPGEPGRLTLDRLRESTHPVALRPLVFVCGPTGFVETVATWLVELGHDPARVKTERFGGL